MTEQAARAGLMGLDMLESWFTASRQMIDLWRTSVREQQDAMLASWRQQIASALAHDLLEDMEAPAQVPAKRQPRTQTAVAKASVPEAA
jgi:hypothetical protein